MQTTEHAQRVAAERLYRIAKKKVEQRWGSTFPLLGHTLRRALLAEELMQTLATQDDTISGQTVRGLLANFWLRLNDEEF
jgi:hypothetical protein